MSDLHKTSSDLPRAREIVEAVAKALAAEGQYQFAGQLYNVLPLMAKRSWKVKKKKEAEPEVVEPTRRMIAPPAQLVPGGFTTAGEYAHRSRRSL